MFMKSINIILAIGLSFQAIAQNQVVSPYTQQIEVINIAEGRQQYRLLYLEARSLVSSLYRSLGVGEVVQTIDTDALEIVDEVIKSSHSRTQHSKLTASLFTLFLNGSFGQTTNKERHWDVTELITRNPKDVAQFSEKAERDFRRLQLNLNSYINQNLMEIVLLKEASIKAIQAATQLMVKGELIQVEEIQDLVSMATQLSFKGRQNITRCSQVNYSSHSNSSRDESSASVGASLFFFSASASTSNRLNERNSYFAHTKTQCEADSQTISVDVSNSLAFQVNLNVMDRRLDEWIQYATAMNLFAERASHLPTWGSPYFK